MLQNKNQLYLKHNKLPKYLQVNLKAQFKTKNKNKVTWLTYNE